MRAEREDEWRNEPNAAGTEELDRCFSDWSLFFDDKSGSLASPL